MNLKLETTTNIHLKSTGHGKRINKSRKKDPINEIKIAFFKPDDKEDEEDGLVKKYTPKKVWKSKKKWKANFSLF